MIYLAIPKAILQNKGNLATGSMNLPICFLFVGPTLRSPPASPSPVTLIRLGSVGAEGRWCGTQAAPRGQRDLVGTQTRVEEKEGKTQVSW